MSAKKSRNRLALFVVLFAVSLFLIFFVGTSVEQGTGKSHTIITANGINHFKKGLDIAGGVRLTYKIDFSKYEQAYTDSAELLQVKKTAQDIILKNIDARISKLGVSDYSAYIQKLTDGEYLIVEIGGLNDIDQAKALIGKTVELEFKLANDQNQGDATLYAERQKVAEKMLLDVSTHPEQFEQLGSGKVSDDIFYAHYTDAMPEQLPDIYKNNPKFLDSLTSGAIYPKLLTDTYHVLQVEDGSGGSVTKVLQGFTIVKFNGSHTITIDTVDTARALTVGERIGYKPELVWKKDITDSITGAIIDGGATVTHVGAEEIAGMSGFDIVLYMVVQPDLTQKVLNDVTVGKEPLSGEAQLLVEGWTQGATLASQMANFDPSIGVKLYDQMEGTFILKIRDTKTPEQRLVPTVVFRNMNRAKTDTLKNSLTTATLYDIEDIRIQDTQSWLPAKDPKSNDLLNGAFFKYASVAQGQTGKPVVSINFDDKGKEIFCNITEANIGRQMAIFVGGQLMTAPTIQDKICGGAAQIDGTFEAKGAKELTENLNSGALPAPLLLSHEEKVSPTLGASALSGAFAAAGIGFIVIYLLMFFMYGFKKANIVIITLIVFVAFLMAIFKLFGVVSSLSAIAAAILTIGMAVDSNVLIFERLKEELAQGKSMHVAINDAYERSWYPIRDGNISTGLIGFLLFTMGVNVFKGFGTTILINMFLILLVNVPLTKELLLLFYKNDK